MSDQDAISLAVLVLAAFWALASVDVLTGCVRSGRRWRVRAMDGVLCGVLPGSPRLPLGAVLIEREAAIFW